MASESSAGPLPRETLEGAFQALIRELEDNLQAMGIQNAAFDATTGIRGLVAEILNIEPSVSGLELVTELITPEFFTQENSTFPFDIQLVAYYDDVTQANIDLNGYITNATIELHDDNDVLVASAVTDSEGKAHFNVSGGEYHVVFNGTENFEGCEADISVDEFLRAKFTGSSVNLGARENWLSSTGSVLIDWGDGSTDTVNNPKGPLSHTYTDGKSSHTVVFKGIVTGLGIFCFRDRTNLTSITLPSSITSLGDACFMDCSGLTSVILHSSITSLSSGCFFGCTNLTSITLPDSITNLEDYCFQDCTSLTSITLSSNIIRTGESCFDGCSGLTSITLPDSLTSLGDYCFQDCTSLTSITLPDSLTSLGAYCFYGCSGLTSITLLNGLTSLGDGCFMSCNGLTSVTLPSSITSLGIACFSDCTSLTSITLPDSLTSLGDYCFHDCTGLVDYQLYWTGTNIIQRIDDSQIPVNNGTTFTIPYGESSNYVSKNYPLANIQERRTPPYITSISISSDKQIMTSSESAILTGVLKDDLDTPLTSKTVKLYEGNTLIDTLTTDNNGAYTKTLTNQSIGTHTYHTTYEGETDYRQSTSSDVSVIVEPVYTMTLVSDKDILSSYDYDSCTITATLLCDNVPASGKTLSYTVKHDQTEIDVGSGVTDANGEVDIMYLAGGFGDVTITVDYDNFLQETYSICDAMLYDASEYSRTGTGSATSVATNGKTWDNTIDWEFTADIKVTGNACRIDIVPPSQSLKNHLGIGKNSSNTLTAYVGNNNGDAIQQTSTTTMTNNTYYHVKITKTGTTVKFYFEDNLILTDSSIASQWLRNYSTESVKFTTWQSNKIYMQNMIVKPL